ncbi:uncharacterized protein LOC103951661 isoform X2 [Pyrus x bretschneideri]|uniref:uncharacterized protein LOC103951661 isoform X2 n=1 Tax=Pyrus x bretschneideri TaxID=225117 RepID=UPI00202F6D80|nr:uncharacterized protein LOC103951661 isoform X2 [Pyrus x bretschneideri]
MRCINFKESIIVLYSLGSIQKNICLFTLSSIIYVLRFFKFHKGVSLSTVEGKLKCPNATVSRYQSYVLDKMGGGKDEKHETTEKALFSYGGVYGYGYPPQAHHAYPSSGGYPPPAYPSYVGHPPTSYPPTGYPVHGVLAWEWEGC